MKTKNDNVNMNLLEHEISDMDIYLGRMQKSVLDKMFFIDKVFEPFECIVDFGCANGELIKAIQALFGGYEYVGYDLSPQMIEAAKRNVPEARFISEWDKLDIRCENSLINISSTIHEVYSYGTDSDIEIFWDRVFNSGFKYVTIRDMMLSDERNCDVDPDQLSAVRENTTYAHHLKDYENVWGMIKTNNDLVHYLLKYSYTQNWEREVRENYIGLSVEELWKRIPSSYEVTFCDHFTLPYIAWQINKDFGFELNTPTHLKIVLKKRNTPLT